MKVGVALNEKVAIQKYEQVHYSIFSSFCLNLKKFLP